MSRKSKKEITERKDLKLDTCKHCGSRINARTVKTLPKKFLPEKLGFWGGIEKPYIEIYKLVCPNNKCGKHYSLKYRGSDWLYK